MANELPEQSQFDETIEAILTTEPVQGDPPAFQGQPTGKINVNLLKLANRCRWLKNALTALNITVPNATTTTKGIAELATKQEAEALQDTTRITPPKRVGDILKHQNAQATESQRGTAAIASQSDAEGGTDDTKIMTSEKSMQQLRHSNAEANTTRRGTVQRATQTELDDGKNEEKYITPKLATRIRGFIRTQNPPAVADAKDNIGYIETNADDKALRIKVKSNRKAPFFSVAVADLGNGHRGYAGSSYGSIGSGLSVNSGGSTGYSSVGAISEEYATYASTMFSRVGTFSVPSSAYAGRALASDGTTLYYLQGVSRSSYKIHSIDLTAGTTSQIASVSTYASGGMAHLSGALYTFHVSNRKFYKWDLNNNSGTLLTGSLNTSGVSGIASDGTNIHVLYTSAGTAVGRLNPSTGSLVSGVGGVISGFDTNYSQTIGGFAHLDGNYYISTLETATKDPYLYRINVSTGALTGVGAISPDNANLTGLAPLGNGVYGLNTDDYGIYQAGGVGNRWSVLFPNDTTVVGSGDNLLKLFPSVGGTQVDLNRRSDITGAIAFASEFDVANAHTISVGDTESIALYKADDSQLYEGSNEAVYTTIPLQAPAIGT